MHTIFTTVFFENGSCKFNFENRKNLSMKHNKFSDTKFSFSLRDKIRQVCLVLIFGYLAVSIYRKEKRPNCHIYPTVAAEGARSLPKYYNGFENFNGLKGGGSSESTLSGSFVPDSTSTNTLRMTSHVSQTLSASRNNPSPPRLQPRASLRQQGSGPPGALYSPQRTGSRLPLTAGEQNSTTGFRNRVGRAKQTCLSSFSNCCGSSSSTTDVLPFGYPLRLTTSPTIAPSTQLMIKRTPSATEEIRRSFPQHLKTMLSGDRIKLDDAKKVYGVGLHPKIAQKRLKTVFSNKKNLKNELGVIMVCPLGTPHEIARADLEQQITSWNVNHPLPEEQLWLHTSKRESDGEQARFSLPIKDENILIARIEFIIWLDKKTQNTAKIMLLGDVPYHQLNPIFKIIKKINLENLMRVTFKSTFSFIFLIKINSINYIYK